MDIVFHADVGIPDNGMRVSINGEMVNSSQMEAILVALNWNNVVKTVLERAVANSLADADAVSAPPAVDLTKPPPGPPNPPKPRCVCKHHYEQHEGRGGKCSLCDCQGHRPVDVA